MNAESVGGVSLDLIIKDTITQQVSRLATKTQGAAQKSFEKVGMTIQAAISKPVEAAQGAIDRSVENAKLKVQETGGELDALSAKLDAMRAKSTKNLSEFYKNPKQLHGAVDTELGGNKDYQKLLSQNDKLQQKLIAAENRLQLAKEIAAQKAAAKQQAIREKQAAAMQKLQEREKKVAERAEQARVQAAQKAEQAQIQAAQKAEQQKQRIREQQQKKLAKAMKQLNGMAGKSGGRLGSLSSTIGKKIQSSVSSIGKKIGRMLKNIKTAFKSAILMASLYAAFRSLKDSVGGVIKQNQRFMTSLNQMKANLSVAFVPVINAIMPALNALMSGLAYASKRIAEFSSSFFGTTYKQSVSVMKKVQSVQNAAKKAKKDALAPFDEINKLDTKQDDSKGDSDGTDYSALDNAKYGNAENLAQQIEDRWKAMAKRIPEFLAEALSKAAEAAPRMVGVATAVISTFLQSLHSQWPKISAAGVNIITTLVGGMQALAPDIIPVAVDVITFLSQAFLTYTPSLIATGIEILAGVLLGISQKMPELVPMAQQAIRTVITALTTHLPQIIQSGMEILLALTEGIEEMLPELIPMAQRLIYELAIALLDHLPQILQSGMEILLALTEGIEEMLPELIPMAQRLIYELTIALLDHLPELIEAGIDLIIALSEGMMNQIPVIAEQAPRLIKALVNGLWGARQKVFDCVADLGREMVNKIKSTDWVEVGKNILRGIANGIKSGLKAIGNLLNFDNFKAMFTGGKVNFEVPSFAGGGIISQPTLAMVGDNKRSPEAVAPLHELRAMISEAVRSAVPAQAQQPQLGEGKTATIILQMDGMAIAQFTLNNMDALFKQGNQSTTVKA